VKKEAHLEKFRSPVRRSTVDSGKFLQSYSLFSVGDGNPGFGDTAQIG
jgi:hypothetical protein